MEYPVEICLHPGCRNYCPMCGSVAHVSINQPLYVCERGHVVLTNDIITLNMEVKRK